MPRYEDRLCIKLSKQTIDLIDSLRGELKRDEYIYRVFKKLLDYCGKAIIPCIESTFAEKRLEEAGDKQAQTG